MIMVLLEHARVSFYANTFFQKNELYRISLSIWHQTSVKLKSIKIYFLNFVKTDFDPTNRS
ncbi:hypothetical protein E4414_03230 [Leptospira interrogans]|nr:hypothetical protein E4414_03230 [Leptospira interrogans]